MIDAESATLPKPNTWPASCSAVVNRSYFPFPPPRLKPFCELNRTSPLQVLLALYGLEIASWELLRSDEPMRMSPNVDAPWIGPGAPNASPLSLTRPMLMLAWLAQVWKARRISSCQAPLPKLPFSCEDR